MKKPFSVSIVMSVFLFVLFSTETVYAYPYQPTRPVNIGEKIKFADGPGKSNGGEFLVSDEWGGHLFDSFCVEKDEYLDFTQLFTVHDISEAAYSGGVRGGEPDRIDEKTAYLYHKFYWGTLPGYDYTLGPGRDASADLLQAAIWFFEEELPVGVEVNNLFTQDAIAAVGGGVWTGLGDVRVINLWNQYGGLSQDQLTVVPVPEPATLLLLGSGVIGLFAFGRRRSRKLPLIK